ELELVRRYTHCGRGELVLADGCPGAPDLRVLESVCDDDDDDHDHDRDEVEHDVVELVGSDRGPHDWLKETVEEAEEPGGKPRPLYRGDSLGAIREVDWLVEVVQQLADDLAEAEGDDREVVAADAEDREAEEEADDGRHDDAQEQEEVEPIRRKEKGGADGDRARDRVEEEGLLGPEEPPEVGAHGVEGHVAEVE